jgi:hypothetical protein
MYTPGLFFLNQFEGGYYLLYLLSEFFKYKDNVARLAEFYYDHTAVLTELKGRFPDWENYVKRYLSAEVRAGLKERGVPL